MYGDSAGAVSLLETRPIGVPVVPSVFDGGRPGPPRSLRDVLEATVAAFPNAAAIEDDRGVLDYRGLLAEVDRLVARLGRCGIGLGDRVGVRVPSGAADLYDVRLGDDCVLNTGAVPQAHSMEDGIFKADDIVIGDRVTVGPAGFVHYGITVGDDAVHGPDSFLMKGAQVPPGTRWQGNPAREVAWPRRGQPDSAGRR